jgi:hypothetical protein
VIGTKLLKNNGVVERDGIPWQFMQGCLTREIDREYGDIDSGTRRYKFICFPESVIWER